MFVGLLLSFLNWELSQFKIKLETEANGAAIASIQGGIKGLNILIESIIEHSGYTGVVEDKDFYEYSERSHSDLDLQFLLSDMSSNQSVWGSVNEDLEEKRREDRDYLYGVAEKGRDLHVIHGRRDAMNKLTEFIELHEDEKVRRKVEEPLLAEMGE